MNIYTENKANSGMPQFIAVTESESVETDFDVLQVIAGKDKTIDFFVTGFNLSMDFDNSESPNRVKTCISLNREQAVFMAAFIYKYAG